MQQVDHFARHAEAGHEDAGPTVDHALDPLLHLARHGGEQVDAEGLAGRSANIGHFLGQFLLIHRAGAEGSDAARFADCGDEAVITDAAHAGQHDRVFDVEQFSETRVQCHARTVVRRPHLPPIRGSGPRYECLASGPSVPGPFEWVLAPRDASTHSDPGELGDQQGDTADGGYVAKRLPPVTDQTSPR